MKAHFTRNPVDSRRSMKLRNVYKLEGYCGRAAGDATRRANETGEDTA
jgi:hypothetical protein